MNREKANGFLGNLGRFIRREDGLVTVEWVALAAAVVVGGIAVVWVVMDTMEGVSQSIGTNIQPLAQIDPNPNT